MKRLRTKAIPDYRIQPLLPINVVFADGVCDEATFIVEDGKPCVEALVRLGTIPAPYTIVLTIRQALDADIIERV
jgi:hypothetical protein